MQIINHRLVRDDGKTFPFVLSPNRGGRLKPELLVIHYTAGQSAQSAVTWLTNPDSGASTHLVIDREGEITQLVPFDRIAWHAGRSVWNGRRNLNRLAIGIELDYPGPLTRSGGQWKASFKKLFDGEGILVAVHKFGKRLQGWLPYPEAQLEVAAEVSALLVRHYDLHAVMGHDEIAPGRKWDPGPAFPMERFRAEVMLRAGRSKPEAEDPTAIELSGDH